jgi:dTDP-4-amino-4,6-dideoxygalactose transaminase
MHGASKPDTPVPPLPATGTVRASGATIPVNDPGRYIAAIGDRLQAVASHVLASGQFVLGPAVRRFEETFAAYCGVRHCIGVANGTDALELALRALGVGSGEPVLLAANAAMYGTGAVLAVGAMPVFFDVDAATGLVSSQSLATAIAAAPSPPRAAIITHLYGRLAPMEELSALCRRHGLAIVEDCAQAHGASSSSGRRAGSFGDASCFSFYPTKNLGALGDGGAVTCDDDGVAIRLRQLRQYGWSRKYANTLPGGRNSRLDEIQAALLLEMLPDLDARNQRRRGIAQRYSREIVHPEIALPAATGNDYVAHLYVVRTARRDALAAHLAARRIASDVHYPTPDYRQPVIAAAFAGISLPSTETLCAHSLSLPCFPELHDEECAAVIAACNDWESR